jgi:hypothetical protein
LRARENPDDDYCWLCTARRAPGCRSCPEEDLRDHLCGQGPNPLPLSSERPAVALIDAAFTSADSGVESISS